MTSTNLNSATDNQVQRRWMPVFRYLVRIGWWRFFFLWILGAIAAGLLGELVFNSFFGVHDGSSLPIGLYMVASAAMMIARLVLRANPEYMPSDHGLQQTPVDVPAPQGQLAYAGWLLARVSWLSFAGLMFVLLMLGTFLASLAKPATTVVTVDTRPVRVIVKDSAHKDKLIKNSEILIDETGVHLSKVKPSPPVPPAPPAPAAAPSPTVPLLTPMTPGAQGTDGVKSPSLTPMTPAAQGTDGVKSPSSSATLSIGKDKDSAINIDADGKGKITIGPEGIRIEKNENGAKKVITVSSTGVQTEVIAPGNKAAAKTAQTTTGEIQTEVEKTKVDAAQALKDLEQAKADAEQALREAQQAMKDAEEEVDAQVVTIDVGKGDASDVAKAVKDALTKARSTIEQDVRDEIDRQQSEEFTLPWNKLIKSLTIIMIFLLTGLKIMANAQYAARASAMRATNRAEGETLKRQLSDAQLKAMQAQVEPHFLFNTLASVDYLIETAPAQASKMQKSLISYLRAALPQMRQASTTLGREAKLITSFLDIMKVRMEERLESSVDVPQGLYSAEFPPMMLQGLVENAIKHGLEPKPEGGSLKVTASQQGDKLVMEVSDTGVGLSEKGVAPTAGTGIGLNNIRERLQMLYGNRASFTLSPNIINGVQQGTVARVELPYEVSDAKA